VVMVGRADLVLDDTDRSFDFRGVLGGTTHT
jgi:hypothetical protein